VGSRAARRGDGRPRKFLASLADELIAHAEAVFTPGWKGDLPPVPLETEHLWDLFKGLCRRRQIGMDANPLSPSDIDAYARRMSVDLTPFEFETLCELDDAVLAAVATKPGALTSTISIDDPAGVRAVLQGLGAKPRKASKPSTE
jgi:hypothetical protein